MTHEPYIPLADAVRQAGASYHAVYGAVQAGRIPAKEHKVGSARKYEVRLSDLNLWKANRNPNRIGIGGRTPQPEEEPTPMEAVTPTEPEMAVVPPIADPTPPREFLPRPRPALASDGLVKIDSLETRLAGELETIELQIMELEEKRDQLRTVVEAAKTLTAYLGPTRAS